MNKKIVCGIIILIIILLLSNFVSAEFWACFNKGEIIDYCNPRTPDRTCQSSGGCKYCMSNYNEELNCYNQGNWNVCNGLSEQGCQGLGGNTTLDSKPPVLTLISPLNNSLFTSSSIPFIFTLDEKADVYYYDNINGRGLWTRVCNDCYGIDQKRSFNEGYNYITLRAKDVVGNEGFSSVSFFIDSKKPKIIKTEPKSGFIASNFYVEFVEENPSERILIYGNSLEGFKNQSLDLDSCYEPKIGRTACNVSVDLSNYDGQTVEYWYVLEDIAGNSAESKHNIIKVDETYPIINYLNYKIDRRNVIFNISITEENFDFINYKDNTDSMPKWRTLCSRLKNGVCITKKSFKQGFHDLSIQVNDKAGNAAGEEISFTIE